VATFIGRSSVLAGIWSAGGVRLAEGKVWRAAGGEGLPEGAAVDLVVRPEGLRFIGTPAPDSLAGEVIGRRYTGRVASFDVALSGGGVVEVQAASDAARPGDKVLVALDPEGPAPRVYPKEKT
jgi:hypothetical protein